MSIKELQAEIKKGYNTFRVFEKGKQVLDGLASLAQEEKDLSKKVEFLRSEAKQLSHELDKSLLDLESARLAGDEIIEAANEKADGILGNANIRAEDLVSDALAQKQKLAIDIEDLFKRKADLDMEVSDKQAVLDKVLKKIADARAKVESAFA